MGKPTRKIPSPAANTHGIAQGQFATPIPQVENNSEKIFLGFEETTMLALTVPPPEVMKGYLEFYPDAAQKFFDWAEEESHHRREMDKLLISSQVQDSRNGIRYVFFISLCALILAGIAAYMHEPWVSGVIGGGTIVALARSFIVGKNLALDNTKNKSTK